MFCNYILLKVLITKMLFEAIFQPKSKIFPLFVVVFFCVCFSWLKVIYDSQATNGSVEREGGSHRESSLLPIGHLGVIYDSQPHGYALFL
jgi:hypothetical protein